MSIFNIISIERTSTHVITRTRIGTAPDAIQEDQRPIEASDLSVEAIVDVPALIEALRGDKTAVERKADMVVIMDTAIAKEVDPVKSPVKGQLVLVGI